MNSSILKKNHVTITGNADGANTIVFAHGFGTDQSAWADVASAFYDDYRLVLFDNVGAGRSEPEAFSPNKYDSLHTYANDLNDICNELELKDAIMVGHSVSGMISLLANTIQPGHFKKMVFIGASPRYANDTDYVGGFDQSDLDGLYAAMANNYYAWVSGFAPAAMANPNNPKLAERFAATLSSIRPDIAQSVSRTIFQSDHRVDLSKQETHTLLLQTKQDIAVPTEVAHYLNRHIKNSTLKIVDAEGHFPHISAPGQIISAIRTFIC